MIDRIMNGLDCPRLKKEIQKELNSPLSEIMILNQAATNNISMKLISRERNSVIAEYEISVHLETIINKDGKVFVGRSYEFYFEDTDELVQKMMNRIKENLSQLIAQITRSYFDKEFEAKIQSIYRRSNVNQ